jgi:hypothetical protein
VAQWSKENVVAVVPLAKVSAAVEVVLAGSEL